VFYDYQAKGCKFTLPMEISHSFAILSDDTNVHVIGGCNSQGEIQEMHASVNVEQLFEKSEFLKMAKTREMKLKTSHIIPFEKERMIEDKKENKYEIEIPEEWKKMKAQIQTLEKKLRELDEEKRTELNKMNLEF
ncbi:hypothetical protein RFI_35983, partial [Reticulomyxa filosa]